jgi:hypothetical protein
MNRTIALAIGIGVLISSSSMFRISLFFTMLLSAGFSITSGKVLFLLVLFERFVHFGRYLYTSLGLDSSGKNNEDRGFSLADFLKCRALVFCEI